MPSRFPDAHAAEAPRTGPVSLLAAAPGKGQRYAAYALGGVLALMGLAALPFATLRGPALPGFLPAFAAATAVFDLVTAILLFGQASLDRSHNPAGLASAYLFSALVIIPHLMAFPGGIAADALIGGPSSAVWLWSAWHCGFALLVCWYALRWQARPDGGMPLPLRLAGVVLAVGVPFLVAAFGHERLPEVIQGDSYFQLSRLGIGPAVMAANLVGLLLVVYRLKARNTMHLWLALSMLSSLVDVGLTLAGHSRFTLGWYLGRCASLLTALVLLVALLAEVLALYRGLASSNLSLRQMAHTDGLTGLFNRRAFDERLAMEWRRAHRDRSTVSLVLLDVDHFKLFNDRYGHPAGDACLRQVAAALGAQGSRPADLAARYGGEEFALLLPQTDLAGALRVAETVRQTVARLAIVHEGAASGQLSVSIGVASHAPFWMGHDPNPLLQQADEALYRAKQTGRNRVEGARVEAPAPVAVTG